MYQNQKHIGIEILRVISMLMVITLHLMLKGRFSESTNTIVNVEAWILVFLSTVAVNCYVLISGYFLCEKRFKLYRVFNTYTQTWFFSVLTFVVLVLIHGIEFTKGQLLKSLLPLSFNNYWFVTNYILLLFVAPIINIAINHMDKKQMKLSLFVLVGIFCVFNTILTPLAVPFDGSGGFSLVWFVVLYFSGAYIKRFGIIKYKSRVYVLIYLGITLLCVGLHYICDWLNLSLIDTVLQNYNSILIYSGSVCLFLAFLKLNLKENAFGKIILFIAPLSFAAYLIHESLGLKVYLWEIVNLDTVSVNAVSFIGFSITFVVGLFLLCALIELLRKVLFRIFKISNFLTWISDRIQARL